MQRSGISTKPVCGVIYVAQEFPKWQQITLVKLKELYNKKKNSLPPNKEIHELLKTIPDLAIYSKKLMPFAQLVKESLSVKGEEAFELTLPFDEKSTLEVNLNYLVRSLEVHLDIFYCMIFIYCIFFLLFFWHNIARGNPGDECFRCP